MRINNFNCRIPEPIRKVTYCTALKKGTPRQWEFTFNMMKETKDIVEKRRLLHALGCVKETWLLTRFVLFNSSSADAFTYQRLAVIMVIITLQAVAWKCICSIQCASSIVASHSSTPFINLPLNYHFFIFLVCSIS